MRNCEKVYALNATIPQDRERFPFFFCGISVDKLIFLKRLFYERAVCLFGSCFTAPMLRPYLQNNDPASAPDGTWSRKGAF